VRILVVSHAYPTRRASGHGIFVHRWNLGLRAAGHDVRVLQMVQWAPPWPFHAFDRSWRDSRAMASEFLSSCDGIPLHHPRTFTPRPSRWFPGDAWDRESNTLIQYCRRDPDLAGADVIVGHFLIPDGYHAVRLGAALGIPVAAVAWGDDAHAWPEERPYWRRRLHEVLDIVDLPVACSQRLAVDANRWLDAPRTDWAVVYGGVDVDQFQPPPDRAAVRRRAPVTLLQSLPGNARVLLMIGQRVRAKGYIEMLNVWEQIAKRAPEWHLVAAGADWGDVDLEAEIARRGLSRSAHWIGPLPAESMPSLLQAADGFVLPSHNEGLSLTMLEAMATGLPTIATDVGGHAEVIRSPDEGWLIPARSEPALARAVNELIDNADERARRGAAARAAALRIGSPAQNASRLAALLAALVSSPRRAVRRARAGAMDQLTTTQA
jgi:glycosyltransferase involved in cell wall biosynthesis